MIEIVEKEKCYGCMACYNTCPKEAIHMEEDKLGFAYPVIDKAKCIECGLCKKVCPALNEKEKKATPKVYACINKDDEVRLKSSSGGIFTLLSEWILNQGGVVFGAGFDKNFNVEHICIDSKEDLVKLRMSKYIQSNINTTYKKAKEELNNGKMVLFTGTTCQIEGLVNYLGKDYENLYLQDIICHGVPSKVVWNQYKEYRELKDGQKPESIEFRNKDNGWKDFNIKFKYKESEYKGNQSNDIYLQTFLRNYILRESCYDCQFRKENRSSDITLADFWGVENILPQMYDNKGTSLVIVNSNKGERLFQSIKQNMEYKEVNLEEAVKYNSSYYTSAKKPKDRDKYIKNIEKDSIGKLYKKYVNNTNILKRVLRKLTR